MSYRFFHTSFREFITEKLLNEGMLKSCHRVLAEGCLLFWQKGCRDDLRYYVLRYLPTHLIESGETEHLNRLEQVLRDTKFIEAKYEAGMTDDLIADIKRAE